MRFKDWLIFESNKYKTFVDVDGIGILHTNNV